MEACADEEMYISEAPRVEVERAGASSSRRLSRTPAAVSGSKSNKRKRLKENLAQLAHEGEVDAPVMKRKSTADGPRRSISVSALDDTGNGTVLAGGLDFHSTRRWLRFSQYSQVG